MKVADKSSEIVWAREVSTSRGPKPAFSRDRVVETAIRLADAEGADAVSMRRIAAELDSKPMSLYRYVRSKEELLDLMVDGVIAHSRIPKPAGEWRTDLRALAHVLRRMSRQHAWLNAISVRSTLGPHGLDLREATLRTMDGLGLDADEMLTISLSVSTFVRGFVAEEVAEQEAIVRSGMSRAEWMAAQMEYVATVRKAGKHPLFMRIVDEAKTPHDRKLLEARFERGLDFLLDGFAIRIDRKQTEAHSRGGSK